VDWTKATHYRCIIILPFYLSIAFCVYCTVHMCCTALVRSLAYLFARHKLDCQPRYFAHLPLLPSTGLLSNPFSLEPYRRTCGNQPSKGFHRHSILASSRQSWSYRTASILMPVALASVRYRLFNTRPLAQRDTPLSSSIPLKC
jgi:hypothetical protein